MRIEVNDEYLYNMMPKVAALMMAEIPENPEMPFVPSQEFEKKINKLIRKSDRSKRLKILNRKLTSVACLAIVSIAIGTVLSVSVLANETLKMKITERIILDDAVVEHYVVYGDGSVKHPTYIPQGYELKDEDPNFYRAEYENKDGNRIIFEAWDLEERTSVLRDIEFVSETTQYINDEEISFGYKQNGALKVSWYEENVFYLIHIDSLPEDEVVTIIESMK